MDSEVLFDLKITTRHNMENDGIIGSDKGLKDTSPDDIEDTFFPINPMIGILTHEFEANSNKLHSHLHFELIYVVSGCFNQTMEDGEAITLNKGDLCIMNPLSRHKCSIPDALSQVIVMALKPALFNTAFFSFFEEGNSISDFFINYMMAVNTKNYMVFRNGFDQEIDFTMERIVATYLKKSSFITTELKCLFIILFSQCLQKQGSAYVQGKQSQFPAIVTYMSEHLQTVTLQSTADHFNMHPNYLSFYIKKHSGRTFSNILTELRLVQAKYYLASTDLTVTQIASLLGYQDQPSFNAMFRKNTGSTPSTFRKINKNE